jgi:translation initiation factor eIF-2B subunit delta
VKVLGGNTADNADILSDWKEREDLSSLKILNILYDTMPSSLVSMVITEVGMIPPSSVPVVIREQTEIS